MTDTSKLDFQLWLRRNFWLFRIFRPDFKVANVEIGLNALRQFLEDKDIGILFGPLSFVRRVDSFQQQTLS